jgi:hypothetical protein
MAKLDKFVFNRVELQDNIYFARIKDIKLKVWEKDDSKSLNWSFELVQPPHLGKKVIVFGSTTNVPTPKNRLTQYGSALGYTKEQLASDSFDTDILIGSYVKVFLETTLKEDGTPKQHVTKLLPLTELDTQQLQLWLQQAQVTGPAKVATMQQAPLTAFPTQPAAITATPVAAPAAQPVVTVPVVTAQPVATTSGPLKRANPFPF